MEDFYQWEGVVPIGEGQGAGPIDSNGKGSTREPCGSEEPRDGGNPRTPIESSEEGFEPVEPWVCGEPLSVLLSGLSFISEVGNVDSPGEGDQSTQGSTPREGHVEDQYDFEDIISLENRLDDFQRWCDETGVESMSSGLWTEKEWGEEEGESQPCEKRTCRAIRRSGKKIIREHEIEGTPPIQCLPAPPMTHVLVVPHQPEMEEDPEVPLVGGVS